MSHVVPDLAQKVLKGQARCNLGSGDQVRHYTTAVTSPAASSREEHPDRVEDFNLLHADRHGAQARRLIWRKVKAPACRCGSSATTVRMGRAAAASRRRRRLSECSASSDNVLDAYARPR